MGTDLRAFRQSPGTALGAPTQHERGDHYSEKNGLFLKASAAEFFLSVSSTLILSKLYFSTSCCFLLIATLVF